MKIPKDWLCECGMRHTGTPSRDFPDHKPVSVWEARQSLVSAETRAILEAES